MLPGSVAYLHLILSVGKSRSDGSAKHQVKSVLGWRAVERSLTTNAAFRDLALSIRYADGRKPIWTVAEEEDLRVRLYFLPFILGESVFGWNLWIDL